MANIDSLDPAAITKLRTFASARQVRTMIRLATENIRTCLAKTHAALAAGDTKAVHDALHSLLQSAGNVGAIRVQDLARQGIVLTGHGARDAGDSRTRNAALASLVTNLEQAWAQVRPLLEGVQHESDPEDRSSDRGQRR